MFAEKSVYTPANDDEGLRVLVMRTWPRGVSTGRVDVWLKELGPTPELLQALEARRILLVGLCRCISCPACHRPGQH